MTGCSQKVQQDVIVIVKTEPLILVVFGFKKKMSLALKLINSKRCVFFIGFVSLLKILYFEYCIHIILPPPVPPVSHLCPYFSNSWPLGVGVGVCVRARTRARANG